jgi:hypothetical protein
VSASPWLHAADLLYPEAATSGPTADLERSWRDWLGMLFPEYVGSGYAPHHEDLWEWAWRIDAGAAPAEAFVAIWSRGGAKSTSAELAVVSLGARRARRYVLYVCDTQGQADEHVGNIATMLESRSVAQWYPSLGARRINQYGHSKGWRGDRLVTTSGLVVDALGLDTGARGVKFDEDRPDLIVLDDIDTEDDTLATTTKKINRITRKLLPAGAPSLGVLAIQNLVIPDGVFAQLADGRADFLARRTVSGPIPAVVGLVTEEVPDAGPDESRFRIVGGEATWGGQDLEVCQSQIDGWGLSAFLTEAQHEVGAPPGGMYDHVTFTHVPWSEVPELLRTTVWVDPAVTDTDASDSHAYCCSGISADGVIYRLESWEARTSPEDSIRRALRAAIRHGSQVVGVETDQGGDTWQSVFRAAAEAVSVEDGVPLHSMPRFTSEKAGKQKADKRGMGTPSKAARNAKMLADYERAGKILHVVGHPDVPPECTVANLERALRRFPRTKPYDLADAAFWDWKDLRGATAARGNVAALTGARLPPTSGAALVGSRRNYPGAAGSVRRFGT